MTFFVEISADFVRRGRFSRARWSGKKYDRFIFTPQSDIVGNTENLPVEPFVLSAVILFAIKFCVDIF